MLGVDDVQERRASKLDYGSYLAAALAHLMLRQNDAVGLVLFDTRSQASVPPRPGPRSSARSSICLTSPPAGNDTDVGAVLHTIAERIKRRGLVIVISDLIDDEARDRQRPAALPPRQA